MFINSCNIISMSNYVDKLAAKEAILDVGVGFFMAFPVALAVLSFSTWIGLGVITTAVFQTFVFTIVSLIRKYFVRVHFKKINGER
jgi:uncharacterized membrane protein